jgi:glycosyltransferase involved in cell wall biosynthesis
MTATSVATGWYVYGVVPAGVDPALFAATPGVDVGRVALVTSGGLAAIVSTVSLDDFDEEPLRRNLELPAWLEEKARAHDRVLGGAIGTAPLVPLRFGTVYRDEESVRRMLAERGDELVSSLDRLQGRIELGVKAFLEEAEARHDDSGSASTGREYLLRKQQARRSVADTGAIVRERTQLVHERLASISDDARANPPQPAELSGRRETMLLNAAYLVPEKSQGRFAEAFEALRHEVGGHGIELVLTGPWPPYNFVEHGDAA